MEPDLAKKTLLMKEKRDAISRSLVEMEQKQGQKDALRLQMETLREEQAERRGCESLASRGIHWSSEVCCHPSHVALLVLLSGRISEQSQQGQAEESVEGQAGVSGTAGPGDQKNPRCRTLSVCPSTSGLPVRVRLTLTSGLPVRVRLTLTGKPTCLG